MKFVNCSNHPSDYWGEKQRAAALLYGEIVDLPFPEVDAMASEKEIEELAEEMVSHILNMDATVVMCQGEFTLTYAIVCRLKERGITVFSACSNRKTTVKHLANGTSEKSSTFEFVRFREY